MITFLVDNLVEVFARELVELSLNVSELFNDVLRFILKPLTILFGFHINHGPDFLRFVRGDANGLYKLKALAYNELFLGIRLGTGASLAGAAIIAVKATMSFSPLGAYHRIARATEQPAEGKIMAIANTPWFGTHFECFLDLGKQFRRDDWLKFSLKNLIVPIHDANV